MDPTVPAGLEVVNPTDSAQNTQAHSKDTSGDGLILASSTEGDKQVSQQEKEVVDSSQEKMLREEEQDTPHGNPQLSHEITNEQPRHRRVCGMRLKLLLVLIVAGTVFVLGLAIGLGVGLSSKSSDPDDSSTSTSSAAVPLPTASTPADDAFRIGGNLNASYYSGKGAWNGSGLAYSWQTYAEDLEDQPTGQIGLAMYYQHYSNVIKWRRRTNTSTWVSAPVNWEDVAFDAKNATPISAVHLGQGKTKSWHVLYIDKTHQLRQRSGNYLSRDWADGPLDRANLTAYDGDLVGLHACWAGLNNTIPLRLWYASDNTTFEEYLYQGEEWKFQHSWENLRGAGGVGCYSWGGAAHDFIYAAFVNLDNQVEIWYQDKSSMDPTSPWYKSEVIIEDVHPASSVSLGPRGVVVQKGDDSGGLEAYNITWAGRDTSITTGQSFDLPDRLLGTRISALEVVNSNGSTSLNIYSQMEGNDIIEHQQILETDWKQLESGNAGSILAS